MTVLVAAGPSSAVWADRLRAALGDVEIATLGDDVDRDDVEYIVMWNPPVADFGVFPRLRGILLTGAGFDHLDIGSLPAVPVVRLVDPAMADDIALYVLSWVVHYQRDFDRFGTAQRSARWRNDLQPRFPRDVTVGVLGAGAIGRVVVDRCAAQGFGTIGWSRSHHDRPLLQFFRDADIVVDLVPLSPATHGLVGRAELGALGDGVLINVGRGATVDTPALIDALDGPLRAAVLDVFDTEPLPADSVLWGRTDVIVTPHVAGRTDPVTAAPIVAASIERLRRGEVPDAAIAR